jgi:uncharacterized metal-binding protein YceD (DUF177 family)
MNTGPQERLSYRDLARQQAQVERSVSLQQFSRLNALAGAGTDPQTRVSVLLDFYQDADGEPCVRGSASIALELLCHRCAELVVYPLEARWDVVIVDEAGSDAATVAMKAAHADLLSVAGGTVSAIEIAEDELLLALPERLCRTEPCGLMPELAYPAQGVVEAEPEAAAVAGDGNDAESRSGTRKPFAGLADMLADEDVTNKKQAGEGRGDDEPL